MRPYDMRHSFASLLIAEGRSIVEVGRQAGHSATMALDTYGHVFDELDGAERISAEQAIRKARAEARATLVRPAPKAPLHGGFRSSCNPCNPRKDFACFCGFRPDLVCR